jgi:hypothetical protein
MDGDPPGMTGTHHHAYFSSTEIESYKLFAWFFWSQFPK